MGEEEDKLYHLTDTDLMWMKVALTVASRAEISQYTKQKPSVGCVIRRSRSKGPPAVSAVGWNGFPPDTSEDLLKNKAAQYKGKKHGLTKHLALHAETNALRYCSENPEKATVYVTHVPCHDCAKQLVSHRVKRVFYLFWMDNSESSIKLFEDFDISCIPFPVSSRQAVFRDFSETFRADHNICQGSTKEDIPKEGSFHLSKEDSTSGTSAELKRSTSEDYPLKILLEKHWGDKVDKILKRSLSSLSTETNAILKSWECQRKLPWTQAIFVSLCLQKWVQKLPSMTSIWLNVQRREKILTVLDQSTANSSGDWQEIQSCLLNSRPAR